jgi:magnesium-transporting ATPase (P-type)
MSNFPFFFCSSFSHTSLPLCSFGKNEIPKKEAESFLSMFIGALSDRTLIILCIASAVSIALGVAFEDRETGWIEGTAILIAVLIVALVTSANDYSKVGSHKQILLLSSSLSPLFFFFLFSFLGGWFS